MDHYATLGVAKTATPDEIKRAYRKLASANHPDKGGDTAKFQEIQTAYDTLSDPQKRQQYDNPQPQWAGGGMPGGFSFNFGGGNPFDDIMRQFHGHHQQRRSTQTFTTNISVTLEQIVRRESIALSLTGTNGPVPISVDIPEAVEHGQQVRYDTSIPHSQLVVTFLVQTHPRFERHNLDLHSKHDISVWDLILGTTIRVTDIMGTEMEITVQPNTKPGTILRLAGRGLERSAHRGNQFVLLSPTIPAIISQELRNAIQQERSKY